MVNREYFKPLGGKISEDTRKKDKGTKTGASHDWRSVYLSQYDWLKGSLMTKVGWLPNETDYSYCEFVAPNTPYSRRFSSENIVLSILYVKGLQPWRSYSSLSLHSIILQPIGLDCRANGF